MRMLELSQSQQGLELGHVGHRNSTNVFINLVWLQEAYRLSVTCLAFVYDTFLGWVGGLTVILILISDKLD